jgi:hypothetical protein
MKREVYGAETFITLDRFRAQYPASPLSDVPTSSPGEATSRRERQREVTDTSQMLVISYLSGLIRNFSETQGDKRKEELSLSLSAFLTLSQQQDR